MAIKDFPGRGKVAVLKTTPDTVLEDYRQLMHLAGYQEALPKDVETILKINISWQTWYPACSTTPWQLEGVIKTLQEDGYRNLIAAQNNTVVVDAYVGERNNKHKYIVEKYGLRNVHLYEPQYNWVRYEPKQPFLVLDQVYPEGLYIPEILIGRNIIQLPTIKCLAPDSEIILEDGTWVKIGDLMEEKLAQGGVPLFDKDGDLRIVANLSLFSITLNGDVVPQAAQFLWRTPLKGHKIWLVRTRTGKEVKVSSEHPFLTPEGWRRAADLRVGDRVAIPRRINVQGESQPLPKLKSPNPQGLDVEQIEFRDSRGFSVEVQKQIVIEYLAGKWPKDIAVEHDTTTTTVRRITKRYGVEPHGQRDWNTKAPEKTSVEFCRWLGYLTAEGTVWSNGKFHFVNSNSHVRQDYLDLTKTLFNIDAKVKRKTRVIFHSAQLRDFLEELGLPIPLNAGNKHVPPLLFRCPDEEIAAFLAGYLDGDGSLDVKGGLHVVTKSERLAREVQYLLTRLGIVAFRHEKWGRATNSSAPASRYHQISVYGDELVTLSQWIHLRSKHKQDRLNALVARRQQGKRPSNWDTIPLDREQFRQIRRGLGFTQASTGRPGSVNNIENGRTTPTRPIVKYFIDLFREADQKGRYRSAIDAMAFLANESIAWDHVVVVDEIEPDTPYLYDFTMAGAPNFIGNGVFLHNTHVFTTITGAIKNSFGGILGTKRHWTHGVIHETLVDLLMIQQDIHPGLFAVMDGTFAGDGPGPRAMRWHEKDVILASADQVAIDAISAHLQGFDPLSIPFIRIAHEMGLGVGDPDEIEIVGEDRNWVMSQNWGFVQEDTFASRGQKMIYHGPLKPLEHLLLRTPLVPWAYVASNFYHNVYWYPFVGRQRVERALETKWGQLFKSYGDGEVVMPGIEPQTAAIVLGGAALLAGGLLWGLWRLTRRRLDIGD